MPFSPEPSKCVLCQQFQDTAVHVFAKCSITRQIWMNLHKDFNVITQTTFPLDDLTPLNFHIPIQFENFTETIALLLTARNYCIWQTRLGRLNTELQSLKPVNHKLVLAKIFDHISIREKKKRRVTIRSTVCGHHQNNKTHHSKNTTKPYSNRINPVNMKT